MTRRLERGSRVYRQISDELRNQYVIRFRTKSDGPDVWRPLAVSSSLGVVELRVLRGYFP